MSRVDIFDDAQISVEITHGKNKNNKMHLSQLIFLNSSINSSLINRASLFTGQKYVNVNKNLCNHQNMVVAPLLVSMS